jgi:hypothetical protein
LDPTQQKNGISQFKVATSQHIKNNPSIQKMVFSNDQQNILAEIFQHSQIENWKNSSTRPISNIVRRIEQFHLKASNEQAGLQRRNFSHASNNSPCAFHKRSNRFDFVSSQGYSQIIWEYGITKTSYGPKTHHDSNLRFNISKKKTNQS